MKSQSFLTEQFYANFQVNEEVLQHYFAPGRVNIIGEHIDYNGGPVMPVAISMGVYVVARKRTDNKLHFKSVSHQKELIVDLNDSYDFDIDDSWTNYPKGIFQSLKNKGYRCVAADFLVYSDLPEGAGLSSSAAIELAFAYAAINLCAARNNLSLLELALLCQEVENSFIGVQCGVMDQFASAFGRKSHAIYLQCATLQHEYVPIILDRYKLIIVNSNKQRSLVDSTFNQRRSECAQALAEINKNTKLSNLCQASMTNLSFIEDRVLFRRSKHVVSEAERVAQAKIYLQENRLQEMGALLFLSHESLKSDYEVSCPELDCLVDACHELPYCIGARMTGAGFGGCIIALVENSSYDSFIAHVHERYISEFAVEASFYDCIISDGVRQLFINE